MRLQLAVLNWVLRRERAAIHLQSRTRQKASARRAEKLSEERARQQVMATAARVLQLVWSRKLERRAKLERLKMASDPAHMQRAAEYTNFLHSIVRDRTYATLAHHMCNRWPRHPRLTHFDGWFIAGTI